MKAARQLSLFLLLLTAFAALYIGIQMIIDPTGSSLGLPFYLLNGSILSNYAVPGWIMIVTVALFGFVTVICILWKSRFYSFLILLQGVLLFVFIIAQIFLLQETFIVQYVVLIISAALIGLGVLQNQRKIVVDTEKKFKQAKSHHHKNRRKAN